MDYFAVIDTETNWNNEVMSIGAVIAEKDTFKKVDDLYFIFDPEYKIGGMFSMVLPVKGGEHKDILFTRKIAMEKFKVIIVEDVKLELKGTEEIFRNEIPNAEVIGTAMTEADFWELLAKQMPDMVLLDLGLGGSTTIGVEICARLHREHPSLKVLIFTGEVLNEKLWVDALQAGADGIILKTGELLTATDVEAVMAGKKLVFNYPILEKIVERFKQSVCAEQKRQEAIDRFLTAYSAYLAKQDGAERRTP